MRLDALVHADPWERLLFAALRADRGLAKLDDRGWRGLCEVALRTYSAPLVHATLGPTGLLEVAPEEVVVRLARARAWSAERWRVAAAQTEAIARALSGAGVPCLVLKGGHTGHLYASVGARASGDLDLLVPHDQLRHTQRTLEAMGYVMDDAAVHAGHDLGHPGHRHLPAMRIPGGLPVEVHWTLARRDGPPGWSEGVWDRARPLPDGVALGMETVDLLLYTCKHLASDHAFGTANAIAGLADVRELLAAGSLDPAVVRARAESWGVRRAVGLCVYLAGELLGAEVPAPLLAELEAEGLDGIAQSAVWVLLHVGGLGATRHLQLGTRPTLVPSPPTSAVGGRNKLRALLRYVERTGLPDPDDLRLEYPRLGRLHRLGYPLHWTRSLWKHAGLLRLVAPATRNEVRATIRRHDDTLRAWLARP